MELLRISALILIIPLAAVAAAPSTQSTSAPVDARLSDAEAAVIVAERACKVAAAAVEDAKTQCVKSLHDTSAQKLLDAQLALNENALQKARQSGTAQEKIDASGAYNRVKRQIADAESKALSGDAVYAKSSVTLRADLDALASAQSELQRVKKAREAVMNYAAKHAALVAALAQLDVIRKRTRGDTPEKDTYANYRAKTQEVVDALHLLDKLNDSSIDDDDYAVFLKQVVDDEDAWEKSLSEREAIYPSADEVKCAAKNYLSSLDWKRLEREQSKDADRYLQQDQTDAAAVALKYAQSALDKEVVELLDGRANTDRALRHLITREGTEPALPEKRSATGAISN